MNLFSALEPNLAACLRSAQLPHACILCGCDADAQACALAAALLCLDRQPDGNACGCCSSCRHILNGTHSDLRHIVPSGAKHKVEQMRDLVAAASLSPLNSINKIFIIEQAEQMTDEGANTLLKVLEEPPQFTFFILLTEAPDALLPTIISRCQLFYTERVNSYEAEVAEELVMQATNWLRALPQQALWEVLVAARAFEKDKEAFRAYLLSLLYALHRACRAELDLPMQSVQLLRSASMLESALEMLDNSINQKLLADVVYLRLWQNVER